MSVKGMVVVMTFSVMAWKSLGFKWTTEALHTNCCEHQDTILMWNYSLEQNETVQDIQWYFNHLTQIAYESESVKFLVSPLYKGRVERLGKIGIRLKNVSSRDTGNYSLYLNLGQKTSEIMQTIFLTVFETPTYQCKPSITNYSENVIYCSTNSCGGIQLSTEWRRSEKYDFVSNESYLKINSSWNAELVSCCLHRQCQNGNLLDYCASTIIFFAEDKHAPDCKYMYTENSTILTGAVIVLAPTCFICFVVICRKKIRKLCAMRCKKKDQKQEPNIKCEARGMIEDRTTGTFMKFCFSASCSHQSEAGMGVAESYDDEVIYIYSELVIPETLFPSEYVRINERTHEWTKQTFYWSKYTKLKPGP